jgi:hypothetical protein
VDSDALGEMQQAATLWSVGYWSNQDVVEAACRALVAGLDSPSLRQLAGVFRSDAHWEVRLLLPTAVEELGLKFYEWDDLEARLAALAVLARHCVAGTMTPRELVRWAHKAIGHGQSPEIEQFVELDDLYDIVDEGYARDTAEDVDRQVLEACRRLLRT